MIKKLHFSHIGSGLMAALALYITLFRPLSADLTDNAQFMLAGIIITLCIWIFRPFNLSYAMGGLVLAMVALMLGLAPAIVFSGFTQTAVWTLIPALFFGFALQKTGLGKRIALTIIKLCRPTYTSLTLAWVFIGVMLSLLTPATTVRVAIVMPIAVQCVSLCKLEKGSRGNALILLTAFSMALIPGAGWLTGVIWGPFIQGLADATPGLYGVVTFNSWASVLFLPSIITTVLLVAGSLVVLKPTEKISLEAIDAIKKQPLEKMSRHEAFTAIILSVTFVLLITSSLHGLSITVLCLAAMIAFFMSGVLEAKEFNAGLNWDMIFFVAMALSLGAIFNQTGIDLWLADIIVPALRPIAGNPWVFMAGITLLMFAWRFVDIAIFLPTIVIMIPVLPKVQEAYNISPLVWLPVFMMAGNAFFLAYTNIWAMMSRSIAGERAWSNKQLGIYGILYFVACLVALAVTIPMWISAGLFG